MDTDEKRSFIRVDFDTPAMLIGGTKQWGCTLIDISLKGALVKCPDNWTAKEGDLYELDVPLSYGDEGVVIKMETSVAHLEKYHAGFCCKYIDIDSISHLRRLMELNLGNTEMIYREITELGRRASSTPA